MLGATAVAALLVAIAAPAPMAFAQNGAAPPPVTKQIVGPLNDARNAIIGKDWATATAKLADAAKGAKTPADTNAINRLKVATYGGIVLALPVWLYQLWRFVTPGLNPREKKYAIPFVASAILLFLLGAFVALLTLEPALSFLVNVGGSSQEAFLTADKYLALVSLMIVAFGVSFEFPVVLVFLLIAHVLKVEQLQHARRWAIVGIFLFAAVITPSQDPYSLFFMAVPMCLFYEGSILIGRILRR
jgi:sec-independent protein translocase protein TatC